MKTEKEIIEMLAHHEKHNEKWLKDMYFEREITKVRSECNGWKNALEWVLDDTK